MSIIINSISKLFPLNRNFALKNVSMKFKKNVITGLIGFNGSGKTTIFNLLTQCIETIDSGEFLFEGKPLDLETRRKISYLTAGKERENNQSSIEHLKIMANLYGADTKWSQDKITYYANKFEFTQFLTSPIKSLSKGNQQKVKIIASFLNPNCKYMFLDEPFEGLDPIMVKIVQGEYTKFKNTTIIISSHLMEVMNSMAAEFYVIKKGEVINFVKNKSKKMVIRVNKELSINEISKFSFVIEVKKYKDYTDITISDAKYFLKINKLLVMYPNYKYSTIIKKSHTLFALEKYKDNYD